MMNLKSRYQKIFENKKFSLVANIIFLLYIFTAFLPIPASINAGLDSSWTYAISQAAQQQLIFGRDIIFTYGPLGYLTTGAVLDENFLQIITFRWLIYFLLLLISILRVITLQDITNRIFVSLSIFAALFIGNNPYTSVGIGLTTDYQILFIFLISLSFNWLTEKYYQWFALLIGIVSGFCILTKLTLGIYIFGAFNLLLIANLFQSFRSVSTADCQKSIFAIAHCVLGAISTSFILIVPSNYLEPLSKIVACFFVAGMLGLLVWFIQNLVKKKNALTNKLPRNVFNNFLLPRITIYSVYCLLLSVTVCSEQVSPLINYLKNSFEISSGYSSAMSVSSSNTRIGFAILDLFLILYLMSLTTKKSLLSMFIALIFILFLSFKHGFVRQDMHMLIFAMLPPLISTIVILNIPKFIHKRNLYCLFSIILISSFILAKDTSSITAVAAKLLPNHIVNNLNYLTNIDKIKLELDTIQTNNLAQIHIPDHVKDLIGNKPVDIIPWEISLVPANHLNWKPRPIFQSYSAYTANLDNQNFNSLSTETRDYILYQFQSIDGRHPFFDEPKTFNYVFCNYKPSTQVTDFIKIANLSNIFLLKKLPVSRCLLNSTTTQSTISWDNSYPMENQYQTVVRASIKIQYSFLGKIFKNLFRAPPVMMKVDYVDSSHRIFRIIPENSENGVIVSHLPRDDDEAMSFFQGQLIPSVKSFGLQTSQSFLYLPNIEMSFSAEQLHS
jgi:hypothetical protein